jgi:hypothetical protein
MAIKANFTAGLLSVTGDNGDDAITVTRDAAGQILINGGAISVQGDPLTNANESMCSAGTATTRFRSTT